MNTTLGKILIIGGVTIVSYGAGVISGRTFLASAETKAAKKARAAEAAKKAAAAA